MHKMKFILKKAAPILIAAGIAFSSVPAPVMAESSSAQSSASVSAVSSNASGTEVSGNETEGQTTGWPEAPSISSEAGCLMDANSGAILFDKNMDQKMYPASTTKIMTALIALEHGNMDDTVTMTQTGVNYAVGGSSNLNTQVGEQFKLKDMMYAMMLKSANDIATQIGEYIGGGSLDNFVEMMNQKAKDLGCTGTHFHNACGMPDTEHYTTAHDLARISRAAIERQDFRDIIGTVSYTIPATNMSAARTVQNHVAMYVSPEYKYDGVIGGKTGLTDDAGSCLVTFCERDGRLLIAVTLKGTDGGTEVADQKLMYDYAFQNFENISAAKGSSVVSGGTLTVPKGVTLDQLDVKKSEGSDEKNGATETRTYTYNGTYVGDVTISEDASSGMEEAGSFSGTVEEANSGEETEQNISSSDAGQTVRKVIIVLSALIVLGIILIIVSAARNRRRRRRHRKH